MHAVDHPLRNVLTNVLGARELAEIHLSERTLTSGEMLLLCTDGVHTVVDDNALRQLLAKDATVEVIARSVVRAALERGSRDNVTALVVRYLDASHDAALRSTA
jgi:protein phosphatase